MAEPKGQTLTIVTPDDFHVHFRNGAFADFVLPYTARQFGRALAMPNLDPPISTARDLAAYRYSLEVAVEESGNHGFRPLLTFYIGKDTRPSHIPELKKAGAIAGKLYPQGVTTGSEDGVGR